MVPGEWGSTVYCPRRLMFNGWLFTATRTNGWAVNSVPTIVNSTANPFMNRIAHTSENITFPRTSYVVGDNFPAERPLKLSKYQNFMRDACPEHHLSNPPLIRVKMNIAATVLNLWQNSNCAKLGQTVISTCLASIKAFTLLSFVKMLFKMKMEKVRSENANE